MAEDVPDACALEIEPRAAVQPSVTEAVVERALLLVVQDRVGLRGFLEEKLGFLIPGVSIRVMLQSGLFVGLTDVVQTCVPRDAEHLVVVSLCRHFYAFTPG